MRPGAKRPEKFKFTLDPTPLPEGFYADPSRALFLEIRPSRDPIISLAQAIIIQALRDGCNPEWIQVLVRNFGVDLPDRALDQIRRGTPVQNPTCIRPRIDHDCVEVLSQLSL